MSGLTQRKPRRRSEVRQHSFARRSAYPRHPSHSEPATGRRIASNFAFLSLAELICRATSVIVSLSLMKRLGVVGYGRIEFAFNVVFWLVLLVRDSSDVIVARAVTSSATDQALGGSRAGAQGAFCAGALFRADAGRHPDAAGQHRLVGVDSLRTHALYHGERAGFCLPWYRVHGFAGDFALPAHFHLCRGSAGMGWGCPANRLGSDLVSLWRGQRHRAGLVALLEELSRPVPGWAFDS